MPDSIWGVWLLFFAYSFLGWCCETFACSVSARHFINRGFLNGPYCPIYGTGALAAVVLLAPVTNPVALFVLGGIVTCAIEYLTSWAMERIYHALWWDYSERPLNLNGRVWAGGFVEFASGIMVVRYLAQPALLWLLGQVGTYAQQSLAIVTFAVFAMDLFVTHVGLASLRAKIDGLATDIRSGVETIREAIPSREQVAEAIRWQRVTNWSPREHLESGLARLDGIAHAFSDRLNAQERRVMRAFPTMRPLDYDKLIDDFYQQLHAMPRPSAGTGEKPGDK